MAVVGTPGYQNVRKGESGSCGAVRPALGHVDSHCPSFVVQPRTVDVLEAPGPPRLRPTPHRFPATTDRRSALARSTSRAVHDDPAHHHRRDHHHRLQRRRPAGPAPGRLRRDARLRLPSDGARYGADARACSAASELLVDGHPLHLDRALGRPVSADGTPRLARSLMSAQSVIRSESGQPLQRIANPARTRTC